MCSHCDGHPDEEKFVREFNERREARAKESLEVAGNQSVPPGASWLAERQVISSEPLDLQDWLERCHTIQVIQQRIRASNDSRALEASNRNSRMLIDALRSHI